jgi:hypothetical protein
VTDLAGNALDQNFEQMIVSDGYIRGAQVYVDTNGDGIAQDSFEDELGNLMLDDEGNPLTELRSEVTSDAFGQIILTEDFWADERNYNSATGEKYSIIIKGGVNMDSGAPNEIELTAPGGYSVINPLSTLVQEIASSNEYDGLSAEDAAAAAAESLATSLGIELGEGGDLSTYDPQSDDNVANRVVATQIATVLAVASSSESNSDSNEGAEGLALEKLATIVTEADGEVALADEIGAALDGVVDTDQLETINTAVSAMESAKLLTNSDEAFAAIVEAQAQAIDAIAPAAPEIALTAVSDTGEKDFDRITNIDLVQDQELALNSVLQLKVSFDTEATDGSAVIAGDTLRIFRSGTMINETSLTQQHIDDGFFIYEVSEIAAGDFIVSATITDLVGNASYQRTEVITVDKTALVITSADEADSIEENSGPEQIIYIAAVIDPDNESQTDFWKYELKAGSDPALEINQNGEVTLSTNPNADVGDYVGGDDSGQKEYIFTVVATDIAGNATEKEVILNIIDLDEVAPTITSVENPSVDEGIGAEQVVYIAIADDSQDISAGVTFSLSGVDAAAFTINETSGEVKLIANPNADIGEHSGDDTGKNQYSFTVIADDGVNTPVEKAVTLDINNLDEIAPTITSGDTAAAIDENSGAGQLIYSAVADDTQDISAGVTFSLAGADAAAFSINAGLGEVTLTANPNFESQSQYNFIVVANDGVNEAVEKAVTLDINNLDEITPTITSSDTAAAIDENSGADQVVYTASADDAQDISAGVTFSLSGVDAAAFTINETSGEVTLIANPNADIGEHSGDDTGKNQYSFTVIANDGVNTPVEKAVTLDINNLDEIAPTITSSDTAAAIDENSGAGQVVYTASADDAQDISAGVTFSLSGVDAAAFTINETSGEVTLIANPNADIGEHSGDDTGKNQYSFTVIANDGVNTPVEKAVTLDINNLDEIAPTITSGDTAAAIDENSGAGQVVYTASADDTQDISAGVTFSLAGADAAAFTIDASNGKVTLTADPDFEAQEQYNFSVVATDAANNVSDAQSVTLDINNLDDTAPTITSGDTATAIDENTSAGQVVYTASADDSADVSDGVTFSLAGADAAAFSIDASTGAVTLTANPDADTQAQYSFSVVATDAAGNESDAQSVTLDINNLDDTAPTIDSGATATAIDENSGAGQVVYTASADDSADVSDGVSFSLAGADAAAFSIDASTGEVTLTANPDADTQAQYSFSVVATDAAGNESDAQSVTLDINDLDDTAPTITSGDTATAIDENSNLNGDKVVYTASADDSADVSDGVTFSLAGADAAAFTIDESTGAVTLIDNPNADIGEHSGDDTGKNQYSFSVIATDAANNVSDAQSVTLDINNIDEFSPTFTSEIAFDKDERTQEGTVFYQATASDSDDTSAGITFSLSEDSYPAFAIDALSGEVVFNQDPIFDEEFSENNLYSFTVIVDDGVTTPTTQEVTMTVTYADEDDPVFTSDTAFSIDESIDETVLSHVIYSATTSDASEVSYALKDDGYDVSLSLALEGQEMRLNNIGDVILTGNLNADVGEFEGGDDTGKNEYTFTIIATDQWENETEQQITVTVNNLDEIAPTITSVDTATAIDENSGAGQVVYTASADDTKDISAGVSFSLAGADAAAFTINASNGEVTLIDNPNADTKPQYSFSVVATDAAGNASDAQSVTLDINNLDDTPPIITSDAAAAAIVENSGAGQVVYTASAVDDDQDVVSGAITYGLTIGTASFTIDATSGKVTLIGDPDYDVRSEYSFSVTATDALGNTADKVVTLGINNLDDTAPIITSENTANIDENSGAGQVVYKAVANDDANDLTSGPITYALSDGSDSALTIDTVSGDVTLADNPDFEGQDVYSFTIEATDGEGNTSQQSVTLTVNDIDDTPPTITSPGIADVDENSPAIYTAEANDDFSDPEDISYEINSVVGLQAQNLGISQHVTSNPDGSYTMRLALADDYEQYTTTFVEVIDFRLNYDSSQLQLVETAVTDDNGNVSMQPDVTYPDELFALANDNEWCDDVHGGLGTLSLGLTQIRVNR